MKNIAGNNVVQYKSLEAFKRINIEDCSQDEWEIRKNAGGLSLDIKDGLTNVLMIHQGLKLGQLRNEPWAEIKNKDNYKKYLGDVIFDRLDYFIACVCNLRCPSCNRNVLHPNSVYKDKEVFTRFHSDMLDMLTNDVKEIDMRDGEPFMNESFLQLLERLPDNAVCKDVRIFSNGLLINEKRWERIKNSHHRIKLMQISIDGFSKESYEANRYPAKWEDFLSSVERIHNILQDHPTTNLAFSTVLQANNYKDIPGIVEFARKYDASFRFKGIKNWGTFTSEEYNQRNICDKNHPKHGELVRICNEHGVKMDL